MDDLEKQMVILDLLNEVTVPNPLMNYYDYDSNKLLDKKIEVLLKLKEGMSIDDIEDGYSIFELLDFEQHWD